MFDVADYNKLINQPKPVDDKEECTFVGKYDNTEVFDNNSFDSDSCPYCKKDMYIGYDGVGSFNPITGELGGNAIEILINEVVKNKYSYYKSLTYTIYYKCPHCGKIFGVKFKRF